MLMSKVPTGLPSSLSVANYDKDIVEGQGRKKKGEEKRRKVI